MNVSDCPGKNIFAEFQALKQTEICQYRTSMTPKDAVSGDYNKYKKQICILNKLPKPRELMNYFCIHVKRCILQYPLFLIENEFLTWFDPAFHSCLYHAYRLQNAFNTYLRNSFITAYITAEIGG